MRRHIGTPLWKDRELGHLRPTIAECAALQGFRPGLRLQGRQGEQYLIVGNAVPPPLATAVVAAAAGITQHAAPAAA
jgi:DNA (cytosine-5)-methyltransferase 1